MTDSERFEDFTVAERKLFWDVLKRPFDDWQIVLRWAVSSASFGYVQSMSPQQVESIAGLRGDVDAVVLANAPLPFPDGVEVPEGYSWDASVDGIVQALRNEDRLSEDLEYLAKVLSSDKQGNSVLWIWEVAEQCEFDSALDLRREVCRQLQSEIVAAGDCSGWLSFMVWVVRGREPGRREAWREWSEVNSGEQAVREGVRLFQEWQESRRAVNEELLAKQKRDSASPLESSPQEARN